MSWHPFRTAPRDHTAFIVCTADGIVGEAYGTPTKRKCCWANTHPSDYPGNPIVDDPRYWQPMPQPPKTKKKGRQK